jgi:P22 coat protein - gene protein 5
VANNILNPSIIAKAAIRILDNELVAAKRVYRGYEEEISKSVNGYKVGASVNIRKPTQFTVRSGAVASMQDVVEGQTSITVDKQRGVDFRFTSTELTLTIGELSERVIKPAMVQLANDLDREVLALTAQVPNLVGTRGSDVNTFAKFMAGVRRLNEGAVPTDERAAILSPADHAALLGNQTSLYISGPAGDAYRSANLGQIAGVPTQMTQNAPALTTGSRTNGTVSGAAQQKTIDDVKNSGGMPGSQTLNVTGLGAAGTVKAGEVFTIAGVFDVNPVTKVTLPYLKQFVVTADATADGAGLAALTICPAIILSGAFKSAHIAAGTLASGAVVTWNGAASTTFQENLILHKNAFGLVVVPMERPQGATKVITESYKGLSVRMIPYYDGTNDIDNYRLDVLFGVKALDQRLATRING